MLYLLNEAWANGSNSLALCLVGPTVHWSCDSLIRRLTVRRPISPIQPYVPLVLLVEYIFPDPTGPTIHWFYHSLVLCPMGLKTHLSYRLAAYLIGPTNHWPYTLIYPSLRQFRDKMLHNTLVLVPGTHRSKWINEGDRKMVQMILWSIGPTNLSQDVT